MLQVIMKTFITLFVLLFSSTIFAEDISDFQIEGISVGDTVLRFLSEAEIIKEIEANKSSYSYLEEKFGEVYLFDGLSKYYSVIFFVKLNDKNYIIQGIRGTIDYDDKKMDDCYAQLEEIINEISPLFEISNKKKTTLSHPIDPSGKSKITYIKLILKSGNIVKVECSEWEEKFKIQNRFMNALQISLQRKEVSDWLSSERIN